MLNPFSPLKKSSLKYRISSPVRGPSARGLLLPPGSSGALVAAPVKVAAHTTAVRAMTAKRATPTVRRLSAMRVTRFFSCFFPAVMVVADSRGLAGPRCTGIRERRVLP